MSDPLINLVLLAALLAGLAGAFLIRRGRKVAIVYPPLVGLLYRDGVFLRELPPGRHVRFDPFRRTKLVLVSLAELPAQMAEVTALSKDQFSFRIGFAPVVKVVDPRLYAESQAALGDDPWSHHMPLAMTHPALYARVAAAVGEAVAARTLAEIFADRDALAQEVRSKLDGAIPGAAIAELLLTSLTLPPETRRMFTDVERSRMEGLAALERARGEQAALRVLANAARLMNDNPALANLRLLQAIETSKGATTIVLGNPPGPLSAGSVPPAA